MHDAPHPVRPRRATRRALRRRPGFSFIEVLFAVMILGIGFILIAGVFAVAVRQAEAAHDDARAALVARGGLATLEATLPWASLPHTDGALVSLPHLSPDAWRQVSGGALWPTDPRYAWLPFVRYDGRRQAAQVTVVVVRNRQDRPFSTRDLTNADPASGTPAALEPRAVTVTLTAGVDGAVDTAELDPSPAAAAAAPGAILVIATDRATGRMNGKTYRLGNPLDASGLRWELAPGSGVGGPDNEILGARAYLVGRAPSEPAGPAVSYVGPAQEIEVFTTFVSPRQ